MLHYGKSFFKFQFFERNKRYKPQQWMEPDIQYVIRSWPEITNWFKLLKIHTSACFYTVILLTNPLLFQTLKCEIESTQKSSPPISWKLEGILKCWMTLMQNIFPNKSCSSSSVNTFKRRKNETLKWSIQKKSWRKSLFNDYFERKEEGDLAVEDAIYKEVLV